MTKMKTLMLFAAAAALTAGIGLPAWSALRVAEQAEAVAPLSSIAGTDDQSRPLILAEDDGHEDVGGSVSRAKSDDDEGECEDDDGNCGAAAAPAPAPAGTVAPPQNGLFDNTTAPKATVK